MNLRNTRVALAAALAFCASASQAIEVQTLPSRTPAAPAAERSVGNDQHSTIFLGGGVAGSESLAAYFFGGGLTQYVGDYSVSLRGQHMHTKYDKDDHDLSNECADSCYANINEEAFTIGHALDSRRLFWLGAGISRVQRTKGERPDPNFVTAGFPVEFVFTTPLRHPVGFDLRVFADLNGKQNFGGVITSLRFGTVR